MKRKPVKSKSAGVGNLKAKTLSARQARSVKGGDQSSPSLMRSCATGVHIKEATITH